MPLPILSSSPCLLRRGSIRGGGPRFRAAPAFGILRRISASSGGEGLGDESLIGDETTTGEELCTLDREVRWADAGLTGKGGAFWEASDGTKGVKPVD